MVAHYHPVLLDRNDPALRRLGHGFAGVPLPRNLPLGGDSPDEREKAVLEVSDMRVFELGPHDVRRFELPASERRIAAATVDWIGGPGPVEVSLVKGGSEIARGRVLRIGGGHGSSFAIDATGRRAALVVVVRNSGSSRVTVRIVMGGYRREAS